MIGEGTLMKMTQNDGDRFAFELLTVRHCFPIKDMASRTPDGTITGCGVQFSDLTLEAKQSIEEIIRVLRKEPLFVDI